MRPVNLIPPEEQGAGTPKGQLRTGPAAYIIVGALALGLILVIAIAVTSKQISDRESEKAALTAELQEATARANSLKAFSDFRQVQEARTQTVSSLAQSRFDWERVLRELSLVLPQEVWLLKMTGTVSPAVTVEGGAEVSIRDSIEGPALEIIGCTVGQEEVAGFIAALEDIDGVTRVGLNDSSRAEDTEGAPAADSSESIEDCRTQNFIFGFEIVVAFDSVPTPPTATAPPAVPSPTPTTSPQGALANTAPTTGGDLNSQVDQAQEATNMVPGAGG